VCDLTTLGCWSRSWPCYELSISWTLWFSCTRSPKAFHRFIIGVSGKKVLAIKVVAWREKDTIL